MSSIGGSKFRKRIGTDLKLVPLILVRWKLENFWKSEKCSLKMVLMKD